MTSDREQELKYRITSRDGLERLLDDPRFGTRSLPELQINHYFDTAERLLHKARALLRIRCARSGPDDPGKILLTWKSGTEVRPGFFDSQEIESPVRPADLAAALSHPSTLLALSLEPIGALRRRFGEIELQLLGTLTNRRVRREIDGWTLEVDRVTFPDGSEAYELEIETPDPRRAHDWVVARVIGEGIALEPERLTKSERLLRRLASATGDA